MERTAQVIILASKFWRQSRRHDGSKLKEPAAATSVRRHAVKPCSPNPMSGSVETTNRAPRPDIPDPVCQKLYQIARAEKLGLSRQDFVGILQDVAAKYLPAEATQSDLVEFLKTLRVEELGLARACAKGDETAWEIFLTRYREKLYSAAYSIAREDSAARELADSLYADLYGTRTTEGRRVSKLDSYTGRGSLEGWLRSILAQEHVNRYRQQRRMVSMEEQAETGVQFEAESPDPAEAIDARLEEATDQALGSLHPEDKFILAGYYLDGRNLADIARLLGVHESTISRKLEKITVLMRKAIRNGLIKRGMRAAEAEQAMEVEVGEISLDVRKPLMQEKGDEIVP